MYKKFGMKIIWKKIQPSNVKLNFSSELAHLMKQTPKDFASLLLASIPKIKVLNPVQRILSQAKTK